MTPDIVVWVIYYLHFMYNPTLATRRWHHKGETLNRLPKQCAQLSSLGCPAKAGWRGQEAPTRRCSHHSCKHACAKQKLKGPMRYNAMRLRSCRVWQQARQWGQEARAAACVLNARTSRTGLTAHNCCKTTTDETRLTKYPTTPTTDANIRR